MASLCNKTMMLQTFFIRQQTVRLLPLVSQVRHARYNPNFQEATLDVEELSSELHETDERRFRPIKAAKNNETTSVFYNPLHEKLINFVMEDGRKAVARDIVEKMLENIKFSQVKKYNMADTQEEKNEIECDPSVILEEGLRRIKPPLMLVRVRKGAVEYQVPRPCSDKKQMFTALRWLVDSGRDRERKMPMEIKLSNEILAAYNNEGKCIKRKKDLLKLCETNRAFAHYRW